MHCNTLRIFAKHTDLNVSTCLEECSSPHETVRFPLAVLLPPFLFHHAILQVRAAALTFATAIAQESQSQRRGKHDFSEVVKAVVQLMSKDGRYGLCPQRITDVAKRQAISIVLLPLLLIFTMLSVRLFALRRRAVASVLDRLICD